MYKLNKRNIKKDGKAKEFIKKTEQKLQEQADSGVPAEHTAKDLKNDLIV